MGKYGVLMDFSNTVEMSSMVVTGLPSSDFVPQMAGAE